MQFLLLVFIMMITSSAYSANKITACKDKPSCIISYKDLGKTRNYLEAIKYSSPKVNANEKLMKILKSMSEVKILEDNPDYIHAIFTSSFFKFIDDVEFSFEEDGLIHFKSDSRKGHFDFGANKKRIEKIRFIFHQSH